ncbi:MAG: hypothetical protein Q9203_005942, partial [Teloschistes exilis]
VVQEIETELEVWNDTYLNKHLAYRILEALLAKLIPEMGERGVGELMEMRGIVGVVS